MSQENAKLVINQTLLIWCGVVIVELFVVAKLLEFPWILLTGLILFFPIRAAMNWPAPVAPDATLPSSDATPAVPENTTH
ncbi:MAG: hypothetical protein WA705_08715 [Candidatus Ozemobacteraceae bacterium]